MDLSSPNTRQKYFLKTKCLDFFSLWATAVDRCVPVSFPVDLLLCTVLESITGWVKKSLNSSKMVLSHAYQLSEVLKIKKKNIWTYFWTNFGPFLGSEGQKMAKLFFSKMLIFSCLGWEVLRYNWCIGLFNHSLWLPGVFQNPILYLELFLGLFLANFGLRRPKNGQYFFQNCLS